MGVTRPIAVALGFISFSFIMWSLVTVKWSRSVPMTNSGQPITFDAYRGLWKQCYGSGNGFNDQCNKYTVGISQLARTGLVGLRASMVLSMLIGLVALVLSFISTDALNLAKTEKQKNRAASISAVLWLISGVFVLGSCSYAAHKIIRNNEWWGGAIGGYPNMQGGLKMTLASGIYVGWVAAGLAFFVAILLLLGCCGQSEDTSDDYSAGSHNGRQSQRTAYGQQLQPNYLQHQNPPPIHHPHQQMQSGMQSYPYQSNTFQTQPSYHNASTMHQQYSQKSISRHQYV